MGIDTPMKLWCGDEGHAPKSTRVALHLIFVVGLMCSITQTELVLLCVATCHCAFFHLTSQKN